MRDVLTAADDRSALLLTHRPEGLDLVDDVVELAIPEGQGLSAAFLENAVADAQSSKSERGRNG